MEKDLDLKFTIYDPQTQKTTAYTIPGKDLLVTGSEIGEKDLANYYHCYYGVFRSINGDQNTWYLGADFFKSKYVIYDMSPFEKNGYIQVGIGELNLEASLGERHYDPNSDIYDPEK